MAIFNINGEETDNFIEAMNIVRKIWAESKIEAVHDQLVAALSKPTPLDEQRAAIGITGNPILGNKKSD